MYLHSRIRIPRLALVIAVATACGHSAAAAGGDSDRAAFIVKFDRAPVALAEPLASLRQRAGSPGARAGKLALNSAEVRAYRRELATHRAEVLGVAERRLGRVLPAEFTFDLTLNAVMVHLDAEEAVALAKVPGIDSVEIEEIYKPLTDAGPRWIGAEAVWNGSVTGTAARGEGVVVGVVDTGVNISHPSFAATGAGYTHTNPRSQFYGLCQSNGAAGCNAKLIGIWDKTTGEGDNETNNGLDLDGHGSHVASTAAGNPISTSISTATGSTPVTLQGVANRANLITYKACEEESSCRGAWTLASIEQAVADQVDVINYSISSGTSGPWRDSIAMAMLSAREAGVIVVAAAGNDGPDASTLESVASAPWVVTTAASSHDRLIANRVTLSGGNAPLPGNGTLIGVGRTAGSAEFPLVRPNPLLCAEGSDTNSTSGGNKPASWTTSTFSGRMVACDRGTYPRVAKSYNVGVSGGPAMLLLNQASDGASVVADQHSIPASHLTYVDSQALLAWLATGSGHRARLQGETVISAPERADELASFSSRGPGLTLDILKPDLAAPGSSILAASFSGSSLAYSSGTSMASPHIAGAAALVLSARPTWNAGQVVSALLSTTEGGVKKEDGVTLATPFDTGAGRVEVGYATAAALYFPETPINSGFQSFRQADPDDGGDPALINYPSVTFDRCSDSCSARREVRDLAGGGTWQVQVTAPTNAQVSVSPSSFTLAAGASQLLQIDVTPLSSAASFQWGHGQIVLNRVNDDNRRDTVIPLAVRPAPANRAPAVAPDTYQTAPGIAMTIEAPGLFGNDFDPDGDTVRLTRYNLPSHGTLSNVYSSGEFTYTPTAGYSGTDSFTYELCDSDGACTWGTATIRVQSAAVEQTLWFTTRAANTEQQGFPRIINRSGQTGTVQVWGVDDAGQRSTGTMSFTLAPFMSQQFNSQDLENGNTGKGLTGAIGSGTGDWRLVVASPLDLTVQSLLRTPDGFVTSIHDTAAAAGNTTVVPMFNPARNPNQVSWLRLVNPGTQAASIQIAGRDDAGVAGDSAVSLSLAAGAAIELSATDLEAGNSAKGLSGSLGEGTGKWRLTVTSAQTIKALSLLRDPEGYLTNLSTLADQTGNAAGSLSVRLMTPAANADQQGFIRTVNTGALSRNIALNAIDDAGVQAAGSLAYVLSPLTAKQFNSQDLENGNPGNGLTGSVAPGTGNWRLQFTTGGDVDVQSLIRTPDGFLTTVHDSAESFGSLLHVPVFNPASNTNQVSWLRLVNEQPAAVDVSMLAFDDAGEPASGGVVMIRLPARSSVELSAADLESGNAGKGLAGALGAGTGKWRLQLWSASPIRAMSLLRDPNGYLTNLSTIAD